MSEKAEETRELEDYQLSDLGGLGDRSVERLNSIGIFTVRQLALYNKSEILDYLSDFDPSRLTRALHQARGICFPPRTYTGEEKERGVRELDRLPSGIKNLDALLGGGLSQTFIYELAGAYRVGKTQICHQLAAQAHMKGWGTYYIDTENTFRMDRIVQIAQRFGLKENIEGAELRKNVLTSTPLNVDQLIDIIRIELTNAIEQKKVRLCVLDSLIAQFRSEFKGREHLAERQQTLSYVLGWLLRTAMLYKIFVVVTNHVMAQPTGFMPPKAAGGHVVEHGTTYRLFITKKQERYELSVEDAPDLPLGASVEYTIGEGGLFEAEEKKKK